MTNQTAVKPTNGAMSPEDMRQAIQADNERRVRACMAEIQATLDKYHCEFVSVAYFTADGRTAARTDLRARE
jgi:hypothetical protein